MSSFSFTDFRAILNKKKKIYLTPFIASHGYYPMLEILLCGASFEVYI